MHGLLFSLIRENYRPYNEGKVVPSEKGIDMYATMMDLSMFIIVITLLACCVAGIVEDVRKIDKSRFEALDFDWDAIYRQF